MRSSSLVYLGLLGAVIAAPTLAHALTLELSNPSYSLYHGITESEIGEDTASFAVQERRSNETGDLSLTSDIGYATAYSESDFLHLGARSWVDGTDLESLGLSSVASEGGAYFDIDFVVKGDAPLASLDLAYTLSSSFTSTDPRPGFGEPGTSASHRLRSIKVWDGGDLVLAGRMEQGSHVFSGEVETGRLYTLQLRLNAVSSVKESTGSASAEGTFDAELSAQAVPEPATAGLLASALAGLGWLGRARRPAHRSG